MAGLQRAGAEPRDPHEFFLDKARVGLSEGPHFGTEGAGCVRPNFATDRAVPGEVPEPMAHALA